MTTLPELDPLIHAPARLRIMATLEALDVDDTMTFTRLQGMLDMTAGNLLTHLRKLNEAGYVAMTNDWSESSKVTALSLTDTGRSAFDDYRAGLQSWLDAR